MRRKLHWEIFSNRERIHAIEDLKRIISSNDGSIVNFTFFSDMALSLTIETEEGKIEKLHHALSREVAISEIAYNTFDKNSKKERRLLLNVNFSKGKGDLKIKIPEVPG